MNTFDYCHSIGTAIYMTLVEINQTITLAMELLYEKDQYLIINNDTEQSISFALGTHLRNLLADSGLNVDCEINKDAMKQNFRKSIIVLSAELEALGRKASAEEMTEINVRPDIIVHRRGEGDFNTLIIEIKKQYKGRTIGDEFDKLKLRHYTSPHIGNTLNYDYGVYLEIDTKTDQRSYRTHYFHLGEEILL